MGLDLSHCGLRLEVATKRHARAMERLARLSDRQEVWASGGMTAEQAVRASINRSVKAWAVYKNFDLLAVFGITDFKNGWATPWALTTVHVPKYPVSFYKASKTVISYFRDQYPQMVQMVWARYVEALRWCEHLGFTLHGAEPYGGRGTLFCKISMLTPKLILEAR